MLVAGGWGWTTKCATRGRPIARLSSYLNTQWLAHLGRNRPRPAELVDEDPLHLFSLLFFLFSSRFLFMFSSLDIRSPFALTHRHHQDWLALSPSDPSSSSQVYNLWQNASNDFPTYTLPTSPPDPIRRSFPNVAYQDDRSSNSRLVPSLPYSNSTNDSFSRRSTFAPPPTLPLSPSPQHIPTSPNSQDERSSRSLIFDPIYSSPSYTLSAAISTAPGSATPATSSPASAPLLPPPPPPSSCSPHTSPSSSPPSSPDCHHISPPSLPSVHAFRLDTLQSVDPSDDPCPLSLHDLMIPSEEQEYQGHSYHFSLQSVSPSNPKPQSFPDEKVPHEESALPKRKGKSKMHTCSLCQKSFPRPSGLRTHMNSHSGDKRMSCYVAFPIPANPARFAVSLQVSCYVLCEVFHSPFKCKASHPNAWCPFGSSCRGCFNFWSRCLIGDHRQRSSARSSHPLGWPEPRRASRGSLKWPVFQPAG